MTKFIQRDFRKNDLDQIIHKVFKATPGTDTIALETIYQNEVTDEVTHTKITLKRDEMIELMIQLDAALQ